MESSEYFQGSLGTYWHPAIHLPLCQSPSAGCTCQQSAYTSSPTAAAQLSHTSHHITSQHITSHHISASTSQNLSQFKAVWAAKDGAEAWAYGPFCQLCCVWQEAPQEEQEDINWQQQSPKQSELPWRLLKTSVSAQVKWSEYLLGDLQKSILWVFSPHSPVSSSQGLHFPVPACLHAIVFLTCLWKKKRWQKESGCLST